MHPYWIKKIEEQRKAVVTTFWVSMVFIILVPLLLVLEGDNWLLLAMVCFGGAALRLYWAAGEDKQAQRAVALQTSAARTNPVQTDVTAAFYREPQIDQEPVYAVHHPEMVDRNGNMLEPQYLRLDPAPLDPAPLDPDDMTLADPESHPQNRQIARRSRQQRQAHSV
ncbi:MAG: hypothetical protein IPM23_20380 [Candidatus Melainabacteria bacterium]|nr:hypothetical protein [Candidatus Melainabacteria bacterium]